MPKATGSTQTERLDLTTLPGGFVVLRAFNYGEILRRRELGASVKSDASQNSRSPKMELEFDFVTLQQYEFAHAILEHNLEDDGGKPLDFNNKADVLALDPKIAQEIEEKINTMNRPPEDQEDSKS